MEGGTETFTRTPSSRRPATSSLPFTSPTRSSQSSRNEVIYEGPEDSRPPQTESGSDWTSADRSASSVSSAGFPSSRGPRSETLIVPSERSSTASSVSRELPRSSARRYGDRTRTHSATDREHLSIPSAPPRQRPYADTSGTRPSQERRRRPTDESEITSPTPRSYTTASQIAPTLDQGEVFYDPESASSFTGSEVAGEEFITASSSKRGSSSTERGNRYTTAPQGRSMSSGDSISSEGDYHTASFRTSFVTADDDRTPRATYTSLSSCPLHSESLATASECESGATAQCHCNRTSVPSPLPSESSVALSTLRSLTPTPTPKPVPPPPTPVPVPVPVPVVLYDPPRTPYPRAPSTPRVPTISSGTSVSSIISISSGPSVPSAPSGPSTIIAFRNPPPTPVPVSRTSSSPVPSSVRLPFQPVPSVRSLPPSLPSPTSESTPTLSSISRSPSVQSVAMPNAPAASEIDRPPSVVPTISSLTPSSSLSSRRMTPRELSVTVSSASWTESLEAPEIAGEISVVPSASPSFIEPSHITPRLASERTPTPTHSTVGTASWTPSSSFIREVPPTHSCPPPSTTPSSWKPSESSVYTSSISAEKTMSTIPSISYPDAPAGSLARAPSIRSIKSPWRTETDVSFESSRLPSSPSVESVTLPPTITDETTPVRLNLRTPTVSSEATSPLLTPEVADSPVLPKSPSTVSTATTESTVQLQHTLRSHSPVFSAWEDSSVTPSELTECRTVSPSVVSSATRSPPTGLIRPLTSLPPSKRHSQAPSVVSPRSFSTRISNRPSISSRLETIISESVLEEPEPEPVVEPTPVLTETVNRLLQLSTDVNQRRETESRDLASRVGRIREELSDLSRFLQDEADQRRQRELEILNREPELVIIKVPNPVPKPVPVSVEPEPEPIPHLEPIVEPAPSSQPSSKLETTRRGSEYKSRHPLRNIPPARSPEDKTRTLKCQEYRISRSAGQTIR
ncbi:hypothetical protein FS837_000859 [Tulasnella sp. UAMH 9824]|nr:hypothetical protein FS837_000859 [Tulasnella sp. UAMH 9824]